MHSRDIFFRTLSAPQFSILGSEKKISGNPSIKDSTLGASELLRGTDNRVVSDASIHPPSPWVSVAAGFESRLPNEPCRRDDAGASESAAGPTPSEIILAQIHALRHSPTSPYKKREGSGNQRLHLAAPTPLEMDMYAADYASAADYAAAADCASAARAPRPASPPPPPAQVRSRTLRRTGNQGGRAAGRTPAARAPAPAPQVRPGLRKAASGIVPAQADARRASRRGAPLSLPSHGWVHGRAPRTAHAPCDPSAAPRCQRARPPPATPARRPGTVPTQPLWRLLALRPGKQPEGPAT
jgi:hypothetical protein